MNVANSTILLLTIVGISGLLYASSFLPFGVAQNTSSSNNTESQNDIGTIQELQNLTLGYQEILSNGSDISNSSLPSGLEKEQSTDSPNMTNTQSNQTEQTQSNQTKGPLEMITESLSNLMGGNK